MKIESLLGNTKADKATKLANLLGANHRSVRHKGRIYFITAVKVGGLVLASATIGGKASEFSLFGTDTLAKEIKKLCEKSPLYLVSCYITSTFRFCLYGK